VCLFAVPFEGLQHHLVGSRHAGNYDEEKRYEMQIYFCPTYVVLPQLSRNACVATRKMYGSYFSKLLEVDDPHYERRYGPPYSVLFKAHYYPSYGKYSYFDQA